MRGLLSVFRGSFPDLSTIRKGIVVLSCSTAVGTRIVTRLTAWLPLVQWTVVQRGEHPFPVKVHKTLNTQQAETFVQQLHLLRALRRESTDLVVVAWTNEPSFRRLQWLGLMAGGKSILVFNEHAEAFFLVRANFGVIVRHWAWRKGIQGLDFSKAMIRSLLRVMLFPVGLLYLLFRTAYWTFRKKQTMMMQ